MEPSAFAKSMIRKWWIILLILLLTLAAAYYLSTQQRPVYESRSTLIMRPSDEIAEDREFTSILSLINRDNEIVTTYSEVAKSDKIRVLAAKRLNLPPENLDGISVQPRIIPGTNIIRVTVEGPNPTLVRDFNWAVGTETISFANTLYPTYQLETLDQPNMPGDPITSSLVMNMVLGSLVGLFLGFGAALLATWLSSAMRTPDPLPYDTKPAETTELKSLEDQFAAFHHDLAETRTMLRTTELMAKSISSSLQDLANQKNGK